MPVPTTPKTDPGTGEKQIVIEGWVVHTVAQIFSTNTIIQKSIQRDKGQRQKSENMNKNGQDSGMSSVKENKKSKKVGEKPGKKSGTESMRGEPLKRRE